ncbi:MAG TPA: glutamate--tRNA ligase [Streptosporangiaceae bacterium]|nr:glutamate--tRNA ligase [Streptosporangiaceae bacterium]
MAPSPTGDPHVGTAYNALSNLAFARKHGGQFVLRIEDTDRSRYAEGSEEQILQALRWLDLEWDEGPDVGGPYGPYRQSERLSSYQAAAQQLLQQGNAYHCWCSTERLAQMRQEQQRAKQPTGYDRLCHGKTRQERAALPGFSSEPVVRMLIPDDPPLSFTDLIRGEVHAPRPDDQVVLKTDGFPTYHLAVVVDDHAMRISHVIRGEEWISSTPKYLLLFDWFGWDRPQFAHMPLLRNPDHSKISKRKNPAARLLWFQDQGYLPQALLNFLALMGYSMPDGREVFSLAEMVAEFNLSRVSAVGPVFDVDKLEWLNGLYLRSLSDEDFLCAAQPFLPAGVHTDDLAWVLTAVKERTKKLSELAEELDWLAADPEVPADELTSQLDAATATGALTAAATALEAVDPFDPTTIEKALDLACTEQGLNRRRMFMTIRIAVTGKRVSPPLHETVAALGRERATSRLRSAAATLTT